MPYCVKCGKSFPFLYEGGLCKEHKHLFVSEPTRKEKPHFDIETNLMRQKNRNRKRRKGLLPELGKAVCNHCGNEFKRTRSDQIYCKRSCMYEASQVRYAERKRNVV